MCAKPMLFDTRRICVWQGLICLLLLILSANAIADASRTGSLSLRFDQLSLDDGLSQSTVLDIQQDAQGYLWFATMDGLNRYDGTQFKIFRNNQQPDSLPNNFVRSLLYSSEQQLWVGTQNGIARYNPDSQTFTPVAMGNSAQERLIWGIFELQGELIASCETGLYRYNPQRDQFEAWLSTPQTRSIKTIYPLSHNRWLLGSYDTGLSLYEHGKIKPLTLSGTPIKSVFNIYQQHAQILLATDVGVVKLSEQSATTASSINAFHAQRLPLSPANIPVRALITQPEAIWAVTQSGIYLSQGSAAQLLQTDRAPSYQHYLPNTKLYTAIQDSDGNLWLGGNGGGYLNLRHNQSFQHLTFKPQTQAGNLSINAISPLDDETVWLATDAKQLMAFNPANQELRQRITLPFDAHALAGNQQDKTLWMATDSGLLQLDTRSGELQTRLPDIDAISLYRTGELLYIGTRQSGLLRYQIKQGKLHRINSRSSDLPYITAFTTYQGRLLAGSDRGLYQLNPECDCLDAFPLPQFEDQNLYINALKVIDGRLYIATMGSGLIALSATGEQVFDIQHGLQSDVIYGIEYANNRIWAVTGNGISEITSQTGAITHYTTKDGLGIAEFNAAASAAVSGKLLFGGINGLIQFSPPMLATLDSGKKLVFGGLSISHGRTLNPSLSANGSNLLGANPQLQLSYLDTRFSLQMTVPGVVPVTNIRYFYHLRGLDSGWVETDSSNPNVIYTNLPDGQYLLQAYAEDRFGRWKTPIQSLSINVAPPIWRTGIAYLVYLLSSIALAMLISIHRVRKRKQQKLIAENEERLKLSLWGSGDELWDWKIRKGKIYRSNIWDKLEFPRDGKRSSNQDGSNIHPKDLPRVQKALNRHFNGDSQYYEASYRVKDKQGEWLWLLDRGKIVETDLQGKPLRMTGTLKDISRLKKAEENLNLFARSVANISDGVFIMNKRFRIVEVNPAFCSITGYEKKQVLYRSLKFRHYPAAFTPSVKRTLHSSGNWVGELQDNRSDGEKFFLELAIDVIHDEAGDVSHYVGVFSDITQRKQTENELRKLANTDTLTDLPNRSLFQANHQNLVSREIRHALLVFDLDNFKMINDSLGHQAGDELLCTLSARLRGHTRQQDTLYRLGGDEFAILIDDTDDINTITSVAKSIQQLLLKPIPIGGQEHVVTASLGIVLFPLDGDTSEALLKNADTAMYHAKAQGHNHYVFFSDSMNQTAVRQLQIESLLRQAIRDDLFQLHYQPKFDAQSGELNGMEALVRLEHPTEGRISPVEFIPTAEDNGLIIEIGDIVLRKACFAAEQWRQQGLLSGRIAVNVSARQFMQVNLPERIKQALTISQLPADCLEIELTEGAFITAPDKAMAVMQEIRKMGVHLSLDDFGTGYSSLAYLQRFPINTLKIDQTFVREMTKSMRGEKMIRSIITIAKNLNLSVIAEGVETKSQKNLLLELECETLQGYLLSRPLGEAAMTQFMQQRQQTTRSNCISQIA